MCHNVMQAVMTSAKGWNHIANGLLAPLT